MAKLIEYDVSGVETSQGGTGVKVKPGVHVARIEQCAQRGPGCEVETKSDGSPANDIKVALNFGEEFDWGFTYIGLGEASDWKLAEFVRAVKLKDKGKLDPAKQVGKFIRVKVNTGQYEGQYSPDMGKLMPVQPGDVEAWKEGKGTASELSSQSGDAPDVEGDEPTAEADGFYREGQPDPEDPDETVGSYDDWGEEDLAAEIEDRGLAIPGGRGSKRNKMISALRADDAEFLSGGGTDAEDEPEEEPDIESETEDYESWELDQLKAEWKDRELGDLPRLRGSNAEGRLKAKLIEGLLEDDNSDPFDA